MQKNNSPIVLCFSGLDPTGGAGIQADIESIGQHGCHAACIITANTVQNTRNVENFEPVNAELILKQARTILQDMPVKAIKIGMIGTGSTAEAIYTIMRQHPHIPVIYDPVLSAGGGSSLAKRNLLDAVNTLIIPNTYILTPNIPEALCLTGQKLSAKNAAQQLNNLGAQYVLVTGTHAKSPDVMHQLYQQTNCIKEYKYKRLSHEYHGSGCTLAASIAALVAQQIDPINTCQNALDYTYKSLKNAQALGNGQLIPRRH
jgi:hydroxymethylpyrimidine/phosphomethylpyrimidine kinase